MEITDDIKTLQQKSHAGDAEAQYKLGCILVMGEKVPMDLKKAVKQFRLAANQGCAFSQFQLGVILNQEPKLALNENEAFNWHKRAAAQNHKDAQKRVLALQRINLMKTNIYKILDDLKQKIDEIKQSESPESYVIATKLLKQLEKVTEVHIDKLTCAVPPQEAQDQFELDCNTAISRAIQMLEKNMGWDIYLTDMLKKLIVQTVTSGKNSNFFALPQEIMTKEAQGKLAEEIENSPQPDQNTTQNIPPSC